MIGAIAEFFHGIAKTTPSSGMQHIASVPKGETIINMTVFGDSLFVATDKDVYRLNKNRLEKVEKEKV